MSVNECGFGRAPDGYCTDDMNLEMRVAQAELTRKTRERTRRRVAAEAISAVNESDQGENDD